MFIVQLLFRYILPIRIGYIWTSIQEEINKELVTPKHTFNLSVANEHCVFLSREFNNSPMSTVSTTVRYYIEEVMKSDGYANVVRVALVKFKFNDKVQPDPLWSNIWSDIQRNVHVINPYSLEPKIETPFRHPMFLENLIFRILGARVVDNVDVVLSVPQQ